MGLGFRFRISDFSFVQSPVSVSAVSVLGFRLGSSESNFHGSTKTSWFQIVICKRWPVCTYLLPSKCYHELWKNGPVTDVPFLQRFTVQLSFTVAETPGSLQVFQPTTMRSARVTYILHSKHEVSNDATSSSFSLTGCCFNSGKFLTNGCWNRFLLLSSKGWR